MRYIHVVRSMRAELGGVVAAVSALNSALLERGVDSIVVSLDGEAEIDSATCVIALGPARGRYGLSLEFFRWFRREVGARDLVLVHGLWQSQGFCALLSYLTSRIRYLVYPHGMLSAWFKEVQPLKHYKKLPYWLLVERWLLHFAERVLVASEFEAGQARGTFPFSNFRVEVLGLGVAKRADSTGSNLNRDESTGGRPSCEQSEQIILFLGRLDPIKNCHLIIESIARLRNELEGWKFIFAGPSVKGYAEDLKRRVLFAGVDHLVDFVGMVTGGVKESLLQCARFLILPSSHENYGMVVAEALCRGLPVIVSDRVGLSDVVSKYAAGLVFKLSADELDRSLLWATSMDPDSYSELKQRVHEAQGAVRIESAVDRLLEIGAAMGVGDARS